MPTKQRPTSRQTSRRPREVADAIARGIRDGRYTSGGPLPSYASLASLHGVGVQTVRTAMDMLDREGLVVRRERRGVFIRPRPVFKPETSIGLRTVTIIAMAVGPETAFPTSDYLAGYSLAMDRHRLQMRYVVYWGHEQWLAEEFLPTGASEGQGVIVLGNPHGPLFDELRSHRIPFVAQAIAGYPLENLPPHARVFVNKYKGACDAVEYLLGLGHRRIGFLGGTVSRSKSSPSRRLYEGYVAGLNRAGIEPRADDIRKVSTQEPVVAIAPATELLRRPSRPTAILCGNDAAAMGAVKAALELGLDVPRDISVVGFDDVPWMDQSDIPLTTMAIPRRAACRTAIDLLVELASGDTGNGQTRVLECDLVIRGTTAPPGALT